MTRIETAIETPDGPCHATLHTPTGAGPWPAVLYYPDAGGVRETFAAMADTVAGWGYAVLLPDIYHRTPYQPFDAATLFDDPEEFARLRALSATLTPRRVAADAGAYLAFLTGRDDVADPRAGVVGYCFGGGMALRAAGHHPGLVAAAATFHGGDLAVADDPDSPHHLAPWIAAPVYVAAAADDATFDSRQRARLERAFGAQASIETYPAAHGFAVPDNPTYDEAASRHHHEALSSFLAAHLGSAAP